MTSIKQLCNKGVVLEKGRVVFSGDIDEAIAVYNGSGSSDDTDKIVPWVNPGKKYNPYFNPLRLEVLDEKGNLQEKPLDYDKEYKVRLTFEVEELNELMEFHLRVYKEETCLFSLYPEVLDRLSAKAGENSYIMSLSARQLLPGSYKVVIGARIENIKWFFYPEDFEVSVNFKIKENMIESLPKLIKA